MPSQVIDNPKEWHAEAKRRGLVCTRKAHRTCVEYDAWDPNPGGRGLRHSGTLLVFADKDTSPSGYLYQE